MCKVLGKSAQDDTCTLMLQFGSAWSCDTQRVQKSLKSCSIPIGEHVFDILQVGVLIATTGKISTHAVCAYLHALLKTHKLAFRTCRYHTG